MSKSIRKKEIFSSLEELLEKYPKKDLGKYYKEVPAQLVSEKRNRGNNPCSCWKNISKGELKISSILEQNNIPFIKEYQIKDCVSPKGNAMKFDFYVDNKYIIEYDGEQHFIPQSFGDNCQTGEEKLKLTQEYDAIKNAYCKKNNIPLIRIPYDIYNTLNLNDLILTRSKYII